MSGMAMLGCAALTPTYALDITARCIQKHVARALRPIAGRIT
jgi:hypothetical protein